MTCINISPTSGNSDNISCNFTLTALVSSCKKGTLNHLAARDCYENNKEIAHKIPSVALKCKGWV